MLSTVLNIIIFEDCRNQWSMSRPLLGLILLNEKVSWTWVVSADRQRVSLSDCRVPLLQYFADLRNSIVNSQPPEKQQAMHLCFENLMEGIERNLLTKNRDRWVTSETLQPHLILIQFWFDSQILLHLMNDLYGNSHSVLWLE